MSTRSVITFQDEFGQCHIYRHSDGYPDGACGVIADLARFYSGPAAKYPEYTGAIRWELPRYEAADSAAGFIATFKNCGGNYYFSRGPGAHSDLEYWYLVEHDAKNGIMVTVHAHVWRPDDVTRLIKADYCDPSSGLASPEYYRKVYRGTIQAAAKKYAKD